MHTRAGRTHSRCGHERIQAGVLKKADNEASKQSLARSFAVCGLSGVQLVFSSSHRVFNGQTLSITLKISALSGSSPSSPRFPLHGFIVKQVFQRRADLSAGQKPPPPRDGMEQSAGKSLFEIRKKSKSPRFCFPCCLSSSSFLGNKYVTEGRSVQTESLVSVIKLHISYIFFG